MADWHREESDQTAIEAVRAGGRTRVPLSMFEAEIDAGPHRCQERIIVCDEPTDVSECPTCGKQRLVTCHFDDDYS